MIYSGPNFRLQSANGGFDVRVLCVVVQPPKPTFLLDEVWDGLTNRRFGVVAAVHFRCGCIDCLHEFEVTASSSSSSRVDMFVSMLVRLSFSVLCSKSSFVLSNW